MIVRSTTSEPVINGPGQILIDGERSYDYADGSTEEYTYNNRSIEEEGL